MQPDLDLLLKTVQQCVSDVGDAAGIGCNECEDETTAAPPPTAPPPTAPLPGPREAYFEKAAILKELKLLLQRALARFKGFHAHERRAAHEAKVMEMLLKELDDTGCIVIADWKVGLLACAPRVGTDTLRVHSTCRCGPVPDYGTGLYGRCHLAYFPCSAVQCMLVVRR